MSQRGSKGNGKLVASVIVPAYKEGANVEPLVTQLFDALDKKKDATFNRQSVEMIYVDDNSKDGTEEHVNRLR